ncbi:hypothetical protein T265_06454 [Opisthorchis viverrini]|uniref:Uncharacterized protein n=1 Tax=Opisthorchis viverrini TaxID=6198 RepID=A0A075ADT4_OPIVI|nr:hypothetical protein T265_06454 [Opisthorchis viverrini]KER26259.1 hypothetical protein T265_06454 [Opisthorchis viverrini]
MLAADAPKYGICAVSLDWFSASLKTTPSQKTRSLSLTEKDYTISVHPNSHLQRWATRVLCYDFSMKCKLMETFCQANSPSRLTFQ